MAKSPKSRKSRKSSVELLRLGLIPDFHAPYHDKRAVALAIKVLSALQVDILVTGGDSADFYKVSSHSKDPARLLSFDQEVAGVNDVLDQLETIGAKRRIYIMGNHEDRLDRYIAEKAPEMHGIVNTAGLFRLKERGWEWVPYKQSIRVGKLHLTHDCGKAGPNAHVDALNTFQDNAAIFHTHRLAVSYAGNAKGKTHVGAMFGHLADLKYMDYMHRIKALREWQLGFGLGYMEVDTGVVHLTPVPIIAYACVVEGKLFRG